MKAKRFTTLLVSGVLAASMLVGCGGINKNETVATLDGQEIKLGVANFAARLQQAEARICKNRYTHTPYKNRQYSDNPGDFYIPRYYVVGKSARYSFGSPDPCPF